MKRTLNDWSQGYENRILEIAREAAKNRGFVIYDDYNEYMQQEIRQRKIKPEWLGSFYIIVKGVLLADGWEASWDNHERRFYPPKERGRQI